MTLRNCRQSRSTHLPKTILTTLFVLFCLASLNAQTTFVSFDAPGASATFPAAINKGGVIAGQYLDSASALHSFERQASGTINEVTVPGLKNVMVYSINDAGQVAGSGELTTTPYTYVGFVENADGTSTLFSLPGAYNVGRDAINNNGEVAGTYSGNDGRQHGFFRFKSGTILSFDAVAGDDTFPQAINDLGQVAGSYADPTTGVYRAFIRNRSGKITTFDVSPGGGAIVLGVGGINAAGEVVGHYYGNDYIQYAFVRDASGNLTDIAIDKSQLNAANAVNGRGQVVGSWEELKSPFDTFGFVRDPSGHISSFTAPYPNDQTIPSGINFYGTVTGQWRDLALVTHGFVQ